MSHRTTISSTGTVGKVGAVVVAVALSMTACGLQPESDAGATVVIPSSVRFDAGPPWQPNYALLKEIMERGVRAEAGARVVIPSSVRFDAGPSWQPNYRLLDEILNGEARTDSLPVQSVNNTEPEGTPNYGLLETILGAEPTSGPR